MRVAPFDVLWKDSTTFDIMLPMPRVKNYAGKINIGGLLVTDEPMAPHTTLKVGGPADLFARPKDAGDLAILTEFCRSEGITPFILGGGANILVSDRGIRGMVIDMCGFSDISITDSVLEVGAGLAVSDAAAWCADRGYAGLHFLFSMPGSVGGAVWMNARCYDGEIFEVLAWVDQLGNVDSVERYLPVQQDFAYKVSPFQSNNAVILRCGFRLTEEKPAALWEQMNGYRADREKKGHFAGPVGRLVVQERPRLRRSERGHHRSAWVAWTAAWVVPRCLQCHANIIINTGTAIGHRYRSAGTADRTRSTRGVWIQSRT
jgi:UDP-N-acetylmuramate dehydrogenase